MKAAYFTGAGGPEVIEYGDLPEPIVGKNEVKIKIYASGLNHLDIFVRNGIPGLKLSYPHVGGSDMAGEIVEIGDNITDISVGTKVLVNPGFGCGKCKACISGEESLCKRFALYGEHVWGGMAEYAVVRADKVLPYPEKKITPIEAAAAPLVTLTAYRELYTQGNLRPGQTVVILGAGSGVSTVGIQLAKLAGAKVIATTSSKEKEKKAYELGADYVINYVDTPNWDKEVYNLTNKQGAELIVDNVGVATWKKSLRAVSKGGRIVTVGATTGSMVETDIRMVFWKQIHIIGSTMSSQREFLEAMQLVFEGKIKPVIDRTFPLEKLREAHKYLEAGKQFGKVVITVKAK